MAAEAEGGTGAPYTDAARARLEMAFAAYELAELARTAVPIGEYELRPDGTARSAGSASADAAQVLAAALRFCEAAAAFERFGEEPRSGETKAPAGVGSWWRPYLAAAPLEAARDLDDWVLRHQDGDRDPGAAPVSGGLVRRTDPPRPGIGG
ncbi:hypothetical protein GCM10011583_22470 [Streptomyces camponoticapitis]|uniref:Uncharacterized protein n=1 Tax=Streptomyces camponoticapitis TaxID=1616125 RepID=A0ABQ2E2M8_9ACTN|nr:hypothetical protein [Streptomyces camponoticapitis]GGJ90555.1 hypothetical protein GCM10011583_22470 [Streptomyces camponoticapitis]